MSVNNICIFSSNMIIIAKIGLHFQTPERWEGGLNPPPKKKEEKKEPYLRPSEKLSVAEP